MVCDRVACSTICLRTNPFHLCSVVLNSICLRYYGRSWLAEVKQRPQNTLSNREEKEMFKEYAEDFNTCTLPHKKYYNLAEWEAKQRRKEAIKGQKRLLKERQDLEAAFNDEEALRCVNTAYVIRNVVLPGRVLRFGMLLASRI